MSEFSADASNTPSDSSKKRLAEAMLAQPSRAPRSADRRDEGKLQGELQGAEKKKIAEDAENYSDLEDLVCRGKYFFNGTLLIKKFCSS